MKMKLHLLLPIRKSRGLLCTVCWAWLRYSGAEVAQRANYIAAAGFAPCQQMCWPSPQKQCKAFPFSTRAHQISPMKTSSSRRPLRNLTTSNWNPNAKKVIHRTITSIQKLCKKSQPLKKSLRTSSRASSNNHSFADARVLNLTAYQFLYLHSILNKRNNLPSLVTCLKDVIFQLKWNKYNFLNVFLKWISFLDPATWSFGLCVWCNKWPSDVIVKFSAKSEGKDGDHVVVFKGLCCLTFHLIVYISFIIIWFYS